MPTIGVQHCLRDFNQSVQDSLDFVQEARHFRIMQSAGIYHHIGIRRVELFAGIALFRIHMAWEEFLESVFIRYMCGARSATGFVPTLLRPPKSSVRAAMIELLGPRSKFLNWSPSNTLNRARIYFDQGEPFATTVNAVTQTLEDISAVRNCFSHRSESAAIEFRSVVLTVFGYMPRGISPGRFLLTTNPPPSTTGQSFLEYYANTLLGASLSIVP